MRYGDLFKVITLSDAAMNVVNSAISSSNVNWEEATIVESGGSINTKKTRDCEISWLYNCPDLNNMLFSIVSDVNRNAGWNLKLDGVETCQFSAYKKGHHYGWHVDQHSKPDPRLEGRIRKISMSLFLNEDYEGGEFDLEIHKPGSEKRHETFVLPKGNAVFFHSDYWHRVRPVKSGVRKSIVAWFIGPPYV